VTWESEVRAVAREAIAWSTETGGDLFGVWEDAPVIYLATRAGPGALREVVHFRLDIDYLRVLSQQLAAGWGLRYLGDWHSHHRLGLSAPSGGDRRRIRRVAARNGFHGMAEVIVTIGGRREDDGVARLHPWLYSHDELGGPKPARLRVLPGASPVRDTLVARGAFPEQELPRWADLPLDRILGEGAQRDQESDDSGPLYERVVEHLLDNASRALEEACGGPVERHLTGFGAVLAAPVDETRLIGFAVSRQWPCPILEIDWIDRASGTAEPIPVALLASSLVPQEIATLYHTAHQKKAHGEGTAHVDPGAA